jgi:hypothetical protein
MAIYTQTQIYKAAYSLVDVAVDATEHFPRRVKQIGNRLFDLCVDILLLIFEANCAKDKADALGRLIAHNEELQLLLRLCQDKRFISRGQYAKAIALTTSVGKQANGWRKHATSPAL